MAVSDARALQKLIEQVAAGVRVLDFQSTPRMPQAMRKALLDHIAQERYRIQSLRGARYERRIPKVSPTWLERPKRVWIEINRRGPVVLERSLTGYRVRHEAGGLPHVRAGRRITLDDVRTLQTKRSTHAIGRMITQHVYYRPADRVWTVAVEGRRSTHGSWEEIRDEFRRREREMIRSRPRRSKDGALYGWRTWRIESGRLVSPSQRTVWKGPMLTAENWSTTDAVRGRGGIHAYSRAWMLEVGRWHYPSLQDQVWGRVRAYGDYVLGEDGWRAERVVVDTLLVPRSMRKRRREALAKRYECNVRVYKGNHREVRNGYW